jgi:hypothetical protein
MPVSFIGAVFCLSVTLLQGGLEVKNPDRKTVSRLDELPNIGKAIADDLRLIGIDHPAQLIGKDPLKLYERLNRATGKRQDPCVIDVFLAAVHFMEGGDPLPWWSFTGERKRLVKSKS